MILTCVTQVYYSNTQCVYIHTTLTKYFKIFYMKVNENHQLFIDRLKFFFKYYLLYVKKK